MFYSTFHSQRFYTLLCQLNMANSISVRVTSHVIGAISCIGRQQGQGALVRWACGRLDNPSQQVLYEMVIGSYESGVNNRNCIGHD